MKKYIIFYYLASEYNKVSVDAESLTDALDISGAFFRQTGAVIVGVCPELLLNIYCHE